MFEKFKSFSKKLTTKDIIILSVVGVLLVANIAVGIFFFIKGDQIIKRGYVPSYSDEHESGTCNGQVCSFVSDQVTDQGGEVQDGQDPEEDEVDIEQRVNDVSGNITVSWLSNPVEVGAEELFRGKFSDEEASRLWNKSGGVYLNGDDYEDIYSYLGSDEVRVYKVGTVNNGDFSGADLVIFYNKFYGMGPAYTIVRAIVTENSMVALLKDSDDYYFDDGFEGLSLADVLFELNRSIEISNLEPPESIYLSAYGLTLYKNQGGMAFTYQQMVDESFDYITKQGNYSIYLDSKRDCFVVTAADNTIRYYYYFAPFANVVKERINDYLSSSHILNITWEDGTENKQEYTSRFGGCFFGCMVYADYVGLDDLKITGKTSEGDPIYELINADIVRSDAYDKPVLQSLYESYYPGYNPATGSSKDKVSYDEFLSDHPLVFWQDPFDRFVEFHSTKYMAVAECAKPVIYLYPEAPTEISVKVYPNGGFTKTDPVYPSDGWFVRANPDGQLYNYADESEYEYLFWEGHGFDYVRPNKGFVVEVDRVEETLWDKLYQLGMVEKEIKDFVDFWLPKMQEDPYYFITFLPQEEFDKIAPLEVQPKPDTIIRVFMGYEGLDEYKHVEPLEIVTPQRDGFTLVEWGGALNK